MRVHIVRRPDKDAFQILVSHLDQAIDVSYGDQVPKPCDVDILVAGRPTLALIQQCQDMQALIVPWAGIPTETKTLMERFPSIQVYNLHHNDAATAEFAVALLLAVTKLILPYDRALRKHDWRPRYEPDQTLLLEGKRALVVGYGAIGRRIGRILQALGIHVTGVRRRGSGEIEEGVRVFPPDQLDNLLSQVEILMLSLPLTEETRGLIGPDQLSSLPPAAVLVNVSRGPIVDQQALFEALKEKTIFGAGLDVWYNYPDEPEDRQQTPPADYPFHTLDNVVLSPHRGGMSDAIEEIRMAALAASLNAAAMGKPIPNPVDLRLGY